jgi:lipid II:glycine glycyltransferase (peptidoglycan interpeptide bridge formation enzyme)
MGIMRILLAKYQGKTIGGIITFHFNGIIYWWGGVMDPDYRHLNPANLLLWEMIKWGIENDLKTFNLGRTRKNTSIYHFKSKWGGKEVVLQDYVFPLNSSRKYILPDPYQGRYKFLSKLWSILPIVLAEKIGPKIISKIGL